jgi:hypothetical protein
MNYKEYPKDLDPQIAHLLKTDSNFLELVKGTLVAEIITAMHASNTQISEEQIKIDRAFAEGLLSKGSVDEIFEEIKGRSLHPTKEEFKPQLIDLFYSYSPDEPNHLEIEDALNIIKKTSAKEKKHGKIN